MKRYLFPVILLVMIGLAVFATHGFAKEKDPTTDIPNPTLSDEGETIDQLVDDDDTDKDEKPPKPDKKVKEAKEDKKDKDDKDEKPDKPEKDNKPAKPSKEDKQYLQGPKENFRGIIDSVSDSSLSLESGEAFSIKDYTKIQVPGKNKDIELAGGMQVTVLAAQDEDGDGYIALHIHVVPGKPERVHRVGEVVSYTPEGSITVQGKDGTSTFEITPDTRILPKDRVNQLEVGSFVTIIAPRDPASGKLIAKGIVVHPENDKEEDPEETE